jgi:hypothetical protein
MKLVTGQSVNRTEQIVRVKRLCEMFSALHRDFVCASLVGHIHDTDAGYSFCHLSDEGFPLLSRHDTVDHDNIWPDHFGVADSRICVMCQTGAMAR